MDNKRPLLSICLPTNGAVQWVIPTLKSIYSQEVDLSLYEVVITDNGEDSKLSDALKDFIYPNIRYIPTKDKGFLNLVTCLQEGRGVFNKMLNHRMVIEPGMLQRMIEIVNAYKETKPVLYFLNGCEQLPEFVDCKDTNDFVYSMHYWVSWSAGIGFWDIDLQKLSEISPNEMFPNTSLLFEHRRNTKYVIWNVKYGNMQNDDGKGGYDLFHTFAVVLNGIFSELKNTGRISEETFKFVKGKNFEFLNNLYYNEVVRRKKSEHTFIIENIQKSVSTYYGINGYCYMVCRQYLVLFKYIMKKVISYRN